jgi:hypothetical protein
LKTDKTICVSVSGGFSANLFYKDGFMSHDPFQPDRSEDPAEKNVSPEPESKRRPEERGLGTQSAYGCERDFPSSSAQPRMQHPGHPHVQAFSSGGQAPPGYHQAPPGYHQPFQPGVPPFSNPFHGFSHTMHGRSGHPKHDQHQYGQIAGLISEFANGNPDLTRVAAYMDGLGNPFWKGALIGAAATLLFTNDQVKTKLFSILGSIVQDPAENKETTSKESQ